MHIMSKRYGGGKLFAAAALLSGAGGVASEAEALCSCAPTYNIRKGFKTEFYNASTAHYRAHINSDALYGFKSATAPNVWGDVISPGGTTFVQTCKSSWTGGSVTCAAAGSVSAPSGTAISVPSPTTGLHSASNSHWDVYFIDISPIFSEDKILQWWAKLPACW